jgi:arabinofuranosyltransferase
VGQCLNVLAVAASAVVRAANWKLIVMTMQRLRQYISENALLILTTFIVGGYLTWRNRHFQMDDSLIYLRYLRNFFEGHGLTYNVGDRFNGLTSPLYSYLLILANPVIGNLQHTTILLSFVFLSAAAITGAHLVANGKYEQTLCALSVVSFNYFYNTLGMETALFLFLTALALILYRREQFFGLGAVLGLLFLTRTEGVFLGAVVLGDYFLKTKKLPHVKYFVVPVILLAANFLFNYFYYGAFLPATGSAKLGQGKSGLWGEGLIFLHVDYMKEAFFGSSLRMMGFMVLAGLIGLGSSLNKKIVWLILSYSLLLGAFYVFLLIPNYHWYYAPFFFFWTLFVGVGAWKVLNFTFVRAYESPVFLALFLAVFLATADFSQSSFDRSKIERGPLPAYQDIGNWLKNNTAANAVIATVEIGTIGWYSDRYIIDILGLTNRYNADYIAHKDVYSWLSKYSPDYIMVHEPLWSFEAGVNCLLETQAYVPVTSFNFPGYSLIKRNDTPQTPAHIQMCAKGPHTS